MDTATNSYSVALTCFTYHESQPEDSIMTPRNSDTTLKLVNGEKNWQPKKFLPLLSVSDASEQTWGAWQFMLSAEPGPHGRRMLLGKREVTATVRQEFNVAAFPVDMQVLELRLSLEADPSVGYLLPMRPSYERGAPNVVDVAYDEISLTDVDFVDEVAHAQGIRTLRTLPPQHGGMDGKLFGVLACSQTFVGIPISRISRYYLSSVGGVLFMLGICICATFAIPLQAWKLRFGLDMSLLLIVASFKTYLGHALPRPANSVTRLDSLSTATGILVALVTCYHAGITVCVATYVEEQALITCQRLDTYGWAGWAGAWLLYSFVFICYTIDAKRGEEARIREHLSYLARQHEQEIDVVEGGQAPGAKLQQKATRKGGTVLPTKGMRTSVSKPKIGNANGRNSSPRPAANPAPASKLSSASKVSASAKPTATAKTLPSAKLKTAAKVAGLKAAPTSRVMV